MQLSINRELLLKAINLIAKAADKRHNMVILGNLKMQVTQDALILTASDLEVELTCEVALNKIDSASPGATTVSAAKLQDIIKLLPKDAMINLDASSDQRCVLICGKSRFVLGTLPATDFPELGEPSNITPLTISREVLTDLISKTQFAMAIQDVRYYLTGMLFEVSERQLTTVATDGHRLALAKSAIEIDDGFEMQAILPRKAVMELERLMSELGKLLNNCDSHLELGFGREFLRVSLPFGDVDSTGHIDDSIKLTFTARLIDGKFPDYRRVMPTSTDKVVLINKEKTVDVLKRVAILSNEKTRGVIFKFDDTGDAEVRANNAEQDEAVEALPVKYNGESIELSFNVAYLQDVLDVLNTDVQLHMSHANGSVLVNQVNDSQHQYVIMPMRI